MISAFASLWDIAGWTAKEASAPPSKPYRAPLFIGDVALPRGDSTEFHAQWKQAEADAKGSDADTDPYE